MTFWQRLFAPLRPPRLHPALEAPSELGFAARDIAAGEVGHGETLGNNRGPDVSRYRGVPFHQDTSRGSWCAWFASWCIAEGANLIGVECPIERTGGAKKLFRRCVRAGRRVSEPLPGDVVCWHRGKAGSWMGHVGIVSRVAGSSFWVYEGNRGKFPSRVQEYRHELDEAGLIGFARLP